MDRLTERKIILVIRETRLDDLVSRYNTLSQTKFYIEHLGADFSDYIACSLYLLGLHEPGEDFHEFKENAVICEVK